MSELVWMSLAILAGLCIDIIIIVFCGVLILSSYYIWVSEIEPNEDKYLAIKLFILIIITSVLMWTFDCFPGREFAVYLTQ